MYGSAIPRVTSKHPGPQPPPEISHCDCAGVNCTQKKAWRPLDGDLESSDFMRSILVVSVSELCGTYNHSAVIIRLFLKVYKKQKTNYWIRADFYVIKNLVGGALLRLTKIKNKNFASSADLKIFLVENTKV